MRVLLFITLLLAPVLRAAILAIDYGAEFTKLSLVKPGVPFDVILDRDSKRKIQSVVGWKREDRVFGADGKMAATRFPDTHFPYVKPLLGSSIVANPTLYPVSPTIHPDGSIIFPHPSPPSHVSPQPSSPSEVWSPTALLAHQISYFRGLTESIAGSEPVNQVIVTVPAWWDVHQRKAYRDALDLQGLSCLSMIGEGTGVALNYAMTRDFPNYNSTTGEGAREIHIIYDSGALSTTATVVAFYQTSYLPTPKSKTPINTTHVEVLGVGWEEVGAVLLDSKLTQALVEDFIKKSGLSHVREDKRALAKLTKEAIRVKHILSANQESNVNIESLFEDVDYRSRMSRTDLEASLDSALPRFASPITAALADAGLSLSDINSVILFGGNTRVPLVQSAIKSVLGDDDKIAQNVNTDEAAVLGAAFYGAALSRQFKMKKVEIIEKSPRDTTLEPSGEVIFPKGTTLGQRKTISLDAKDDITLEFAQAGQPVLSVQLIDVASSLNNFSSPEPTINITLRLDHRGHLAAANAVLFSNITEVDADTKEGGVAGALKGLFGGKKDKDAGESAKEAEIMEEIEAVTGTSLKKAGKEKIAVKFRERVLGIQPMTGEEKRTTLARLTSIAAFEAAKTAREEARNVLEGYLYRLSGLLSSETENRALYDFGTEKERTTMHALVSSTFEWLGEHAEKADEKTLKEKRSALEQLEAPIIFRFSEFNSRGKALEDFHNAMLAARTFLVGAKKNNTIALDAASSATPEKPVAPPKYTEEELTSVDVMLKEYEGWVDPLMEKQVKIDMDGDRTADPVILVADLNDRGKKLQTHVLKMLNRKPPRAPRPSTSASSSSTTSSTTSTTATSATESPSSSTSSTAHSAPVHEEL